MQPHAASRWRIIAAAALFSTGGAGIKASSFGSWQVACLRSGIAALAILILLPESRRRWSGKTAAVACAYALTMILFVHANKLTTAASTIFLQATAPLYLLLLGPWLLREPVRRRDLIFMMALAAGLAMFFVGVDPAGSHAPDPLKGNLAALGSGFCWAFTVTGLRWAARGHEPGSGSAVVVVFAGNLIACAVCLPPALPFAPPSSTDAVLVIYLGVFQIGLAYVLLVRGMSRVPALEASLLMLVEPVLNPIWAWLAHGERPGDWTLAAGVLILVATAIRTWSETRRIVTQEPTSSCP